MDAPQSNPQPPSPPPPQPLRIHTMQQDLAAAAAPSRFDLRHRRPLPKSERMEDLRQKPIEEPLKLPLSAHKPLTPPSSQTNYLTHPVFLWIAGLILFAILLIIIVAITTTL